MKFPSASKLLLACGLGLCSLTAAAYERDADRPGNDIYRLADADMSADRCARLCDNNAQCQAWVLVKDGSQGGVNVCYLKDRAAPAQANACCDSGAKADAIDANVAFDADRPGNDILRLVEAGLDDASCAQRCENTAQCQAWVLVKDGSQGAANVCYLKDRAAPARANACCNTGVRRIAAATPPPPAKTSVTLDMLAYSGHGMIFDAKGRQLKLAAEDIAAMQDGMIGALRKSNPKPASEELGTAIDQARVLLQSQQLGTDEAIQLRGWIIRAQLQGASAQQRNQYAWRNDALWTDYFIRNRERFRQLTPALRELLARLGETGPDTTAGIAYAAQCAARGVPIPPDFALRGTPWVEQGQLRENLLQPGSYAAVWTYSDPARRGACIALPRGTLPPGTRLGNVALADVAPGLAGIICQSAVTGAACIWDSIPLGSANALDWTRQTMVIAQLKNGSNLENSESARCTGCHTGNNVYQISPDDETWARVLRGPLRGPSTGTFTTRVDGPADRPGGGHYTPIAQPEWTNPDPGPAEDWRRSPCGSCHEPPRGRYSGTPRMEPLCSRLPPFNPAAPVYNHTLCYGNP